MPGDPSCVAKVDSCAARPERTTSPPTRVARDIPGDNGRALRRTVTRARTSFVTATSSSNSTGRSGSGSGAGARTISTTPDGSSSQSSRAGSSSTGRSCTSCETSVRSRPSAGSRSAASGTVTRVPGGSPGAACSSRTWIYANGSSRAEGKNHDSTARPSRTPSIRPAPCASQTSRNPRPNKPRLSRRSGSSPSTPRRRSTVAASTPTPSSEQRISKRQLVRAGTRSARI